MSSCISVVEDERKGEGDVRGVSLDALNGGVTAVQGDNIVYQTLASGGERKGFGGVGVPVF